MSSYLMIRTIAIVTALAGIYLVIKGYYGMIKIIASQNNPDYTIKRFSRESERREENSLKLIFSCVASIGMIIGASAFAIITWTV